MNDIVLEFLEKLGKNPDNIKVDYDSDQVIFQEPGNPYKFVYYKESMYPYKGERIKAFFSFLILIIFYLFIITFIIYLIKYLFLK